MKLFYSHEVDYIREFEKVTAAGKYVFRENAVATFAETTASPLIVIPDHLGKIHIGDIKEPALVWTYK